MGALTEKLEALESEINHKIVSLVEIEGVGQESDVVLERVLKLEDGKHDELMYNIEGTSTYTVAVSPYALIGKNGHTYSHQGIDLEQLCEIVDAFTLVEADELIEMWLEAEEENRKHTTEGEAKCLQLKEAFQQRFENLSEVEKQHVKDYLDSVGG